MITQGTRTFIIRPTPMGKRVFPIEHAEAERLVEAGEAIRHKTRLFESKVMAKQDAPPPVDDPAPEEASAQTYQTRDMQASRTSDWRALKKTVGEVLNKDARKVTKAEVEEYLANETDK